MSLNVVVFIRHSLKPERHFELSTEYYSGTAGNRNGAGQIISPADLSALEAALRLKTDYNCSLIALAVGPFAAVESLLEALSMGVDRAVLLCDKYFVRAEAEEMPRFLASGIKMAVPEYDLVIYGSGMNDVISDVLGEKLADYLGIGLVSGLLDLKVSCSCIEIEVETGGTTKRLHPPLPFVLRVLEEAAGKTPYRPYSDGVREKEIHLINAFNLGMRNW